MEAAKRREIVWEGVYAGIKVNSKSPCRFVIREVPHHWSRLVSSMQFSQVQQQGWNFRAWSGYSQGDAASMKEGEKAED